MTTRRSDRPFGSCPPRRRVPAFVPAPLRARADGWTRLRQAEFLGRLAETGSVAAAARAVGMAREGAYRLRRRRGAESFAAAWDAVTGAAPPARKVTAELRFERAMHGTLRPVLRDGRFLAIAQKSDVAALLALLARLDRAERSGRRRDERSRERNGDPASPSPREPDGRR